MTGPSTLIGTPLDETDLPYAVNARITASMQRTTQVKFMPPV